MKKLLAVMFAVLIVIAAVPMSHAAYHWESVLDIPGVTEVTTFKDSYGVTQTLVTVDASSVVVTLLVDAGQFDLGGTCWSVEEDAGLYFVGAGFDPVCTEEYVNGAGGNLYRRAGAQYILEVPGLYVFDTTDVKKCVFLELTGKGGSAGSAGNAENSGNNGGNGMAVGTPGDDIMYPVDYYGRKLALNIPYYSIDSFPAVYRHMYGQNIDHYVVEDGTVVNAPSGTYFTYCDYGKDTAYESYNNWCEINDTVWTLTDPDRRCTLLISDGSFISFYVTKNGIINYTTDYIGDTQYDENAAGEGVRFLDVTVDAYYYQPVEWAVANGITQGTSESTFSPDSPCTRGQILTFLWRAAGCPPHYIGTSPISDIAVGDYYYDAVLWAYANGILEPLYGIADPNAPCTRAMTVKFLWLFFGSQYVEFPAPFTDVPAKADYAPAAAWALANGITQGTSDTTFTPDQICTRGQIVTFLMRAMDNAR